MARRVLATSPNSRRLAFRLLGTLSLLLPLASCQPVGPAPGGGTASHALATGAEDPRVVLAVSRPDEPAQEPDLIDALEQRVLKAVARAKDSVVALEYTAADAPLGARRVASGVVISPEGDVLSVRIDPPSSASLPIVARDASGRRLPATWVAADPRTGLTLLKIPPGQARPATPSARDARAGLPVFLVGNPFGLGHSVSRGYVAGTQRRLQFGAHPLGGLIQIDAGLHPGDSGALVADLRGDWIGLVRSGLAQPPRDRGREKDRDRDKEPEKEDALRGGPAPGQGSGHDLGFAIPAHHALWVAGQLRAHGKVERAFLGVVTNTLTASPGVEGIEIKAVLAESPAEIAGLKPGDRIVAVSGEPVQSPLDLNDRLDRTAAGDAVTVDYLRGASRSSAPLRTTLLTTHRPAPKDDPPAVARKP